LQPRSVKLPSKNILRNMIDGQPSPVCLVDVRNDNWRIVYFNPAFLRALDLPSGQVSGQDAAPLLSKIGGSGVITAIDSASEVRPQTEFSAVIAGKETPDQQVSGRVMLAESGSALRIVFFQVTSVSEAATGTTASLNTLPSDSVTVFLKKDPWIALLRRDAAIAAREQSWLSVIVFRIDAFESYVETFGQHAGDSALKRIAHSVRRRLQRAGDTAARVAHDELAVLIHSTSAPSARKFADAIASDIQALAIHHPKSPVGRHLGVTIGVCGRVPRNEDDATAMLEQARAQLDAPEGVVTLYPSLEESGKADKQSSLK
ncbi:MAG: sensor domain-containing diguanylate cyclase, partial [Pseudomonadota bacterium]